MGVVGATVMLVSLIWPALLFAVLVQGTFIVMKVSKHVRWPWWRVLFPTWGSAIIAAATISLFLLTPPPRLLPWNTELQLTFMCL